MIVIIVGNLGSGKTCSEVINMINDKSPMKYYSNIITKNVPNNTTITRGMVLSKTLVETKTKRSGESVPVYKTEANTEFWLNLPKPITVVLDEGHTLFNSRKSMKNVPIVTWVTTLRKITSDTSGMQGSLRILTQDILLIDRVVRELASEVRYCIGHWLMECAECLTIWQENSEMPLSLMYRVCPSCKGVQLRKVELMVQVFFFKNCEHFLRWKCARDFKKEVEGSEPLFIYPYYNAEDYFGYYNTFQIENLFED